MNNTLKTVKICVNNKPLDGNESGVVGTPILSGIVSDLMRFHSMMRQSMSSAYGISQEFDHSIRFGGY